MLQPIALCLMLLLAAAVLSKRKSMNRVCFWMALGILTLCGNQWVADGFTGNLEREYLPSYPLPHADCIVVLSGGVLDQTAPRPTIEITQEGNRVLYAAQLYRQGKAPRILCTGGIVPGGTRVRAEAEDMSEFLEMLGVPKDAILKETQARNTHEHGVNLFPILQQRGFKHILLVTSAMHMPRSMGVFRRLCPGIDWTPAPTDFRVVQHISLPWYKRFSGFVPTPNAMAEFSAVAHEYVGMSYYKLRGWM